MSSKINILKEPEDPNSASISEEKQELFDLIGQDLSRFSETGVSFVNREIYLTDVTQSSAIRFHKNLLALENLSDEPIKVHIHSNGGLVDAGWAIYDSIMNSRCKITGICWGVCASMATVILQACDLRLLTSHVTFMVHEGSDTLTGEMKARDPISYGFEAKRQLSQMYDALSSKTNMTKTQLETLMSKTDLFLTTQEVLGLSLADKLVVPRKKPGTKGKIDLKVFKRILSQKSLSTIHKKGKGD